MKLPNDAFKLGILALFVLSSPIQPLAQTITLTSPVAPVVAAEGDEFFTDVINDRKDFDKRRDILWEENFDEPTVDVVGGNWTGNTLSGDAYVFPLHPGFGDNPDTTQNDSALNIGATGDNFPIASSKYTHVTYIDTISDRSTRSLNWTDIVLFPDGTLAALALDGWLTNTQLVPFPNNVPILYSYPLASFSDWTGSPVRGLRADPSTFAAPGTGFEFDWFRVSDPNSTTVLNITWSTLGINESFPPRVNIYIDNDNTGFDGTLLATWESKPPELMQAPSSGDFVRPLMSDGSFDFPLAGLPPGEYYFYLEVWTNRQGDAKLATSGYSAKVTVTAKPEVTIASPSMTSGPDYATDVLADPWDFDNLDDVANFNLPSFQRNFNFISLANSIFTAQAIIPPGAPPEQAESDVQVWMNISQTTPIDTSKYRYLTYTLELDETGYGNITDKVSDEGGWVTRIVWWNEGIDVDGSATNDIIVYEDLQTYTVDLTPNSVLEPDDLFAAQTGWTGNASIRNLRIDPAEVNDPTNFFLHDVKLRGKSAPTVDGTFDIEFTITDLDSSSITVDIFQDNDQSGADGSQVAGPLVLSPGSHTVRINTQSLGPADLYFYIVASDGTNSSTTYSEAPLTFAYTQGGSTAPPSPPSIDSVEFDENQGALLVTVVPANGTEIVSDYEVNCSRDGGGAITGTGIGPVITVAGAEAGETYSCSASATNGSGTSGVSSAFVVEIEGLISGLPIWLLEAIQQ